MAKEKAKSSMGMEENIASMLCYIVVWVTGFIFFFMEKENKTIRFHALQSILTFLPLTVIGWIFYGPLGISYTRYSNPYGGGYGYGIPTVSIFWYIGMLINVVMFILWLILVFKAYKGEKFKLPIIGDIAEKHA